MKKKKKKDDMLTDTEKPDKNALERTRDLALVSRVKKGDQEALAELVSSYQQRILAVVYKMTGDWHVAQDIAQDVFITLIEKLHTFDQKRSFFSWIYRVAINRSIDWLRRKEREQNHLYNRTEAPFHETTSEDLMIKREMRRKVHQIIDLMPVKYRTMMILRDIEGMGTDRIAEILDIVPATARWRMFQARKLFRELWLQEEVT